MFSNEEISSFNDLEYSLYEYIAKHTEKVIYMRIRELADETHVSTTSILRFCKKMNCDGFSEFKVKLKIYLEEKDNPRKQLRSGYDSLSEFIERTLKGNFEPYIKESAELISQSDNIIFFGIGTSGILAEYGARFFSNLDSFSLYIKDPFFPIKSNISKDTVIIVLSVSGESPDVIKQAIQSKACGGKVISITNTRNCSLAKVADINIPYYVTEEKYEDSNITTQIPVIYLLESLARETYKLKNQM